MKRVYIAALSLACVAATASAQVKTYKSPVIKTSNTVAYALPQTTLKVTVVAERECVRTGPYARFAQKFLGAIAPLADKDMYRIVSARIGYTEEADPAAVYVLENPDKSPAQLYRSTPEGFVALPLDGTDPARDAFAPNAPRPGRPMPGDKITVISHIDSDTSFLKVPIDKNSTLQKSIESQAADAANTIFTLRKRRMELVTGEAGENVFGEGLKAALKEIDRLEQEYLALFLGKQYREKIVKEYEITPEKDKNNPIVCRFSETAGLLPASDLSGRPIVMEMTAENKTENSPLARRTSKDPRGMVSYRIADIVNCKLVDGKTEIAQQRVPIYQFGITVEIPVTSLK